VLLSATSELLTTIVDYNAVVAGNAKVTEYVIGVFLPGVDPTTGGQPVTSVTVLKARFTLVAGTTDCYRMTPTELLASPANAERTVALKGRRTVPTVVEGLWGPASNPFGVLGAPAAPSGTRITP
jgi:hypothetical protein